MGKGHTGANARRCAPHSIGLVVRGLIGRGAHLKVGRTMSARTRGNKIFGGATVCGFTLTMVFEKPSLDCLPRALWSMANQMLGEFEVTWPASVKERGEISGPAYMDAGQFINIRVCIAYRVSRFQAQGTMTAVPTATASTTTVRSPPCSGGASL